MKTTFIHGEKAKFFVIMDGEYITDFLSKKRATEHAKNLRLLGFFAVVVSKKDLPIFK